MLLKAILFDNLSIKQLEKVASPSFKKLIASSQGRQITENLLQKIKRQKAHIIHSGLLDNNIAARKSQLVLVKKAGSRLINVAVHFKLKIQPTEILCSLAACMAQNHLIKSGN